jgi:hypothetical protein
VLYTSSPASFVLSISQLNVPIAAENPLHHFFTESSLEAEPLDKTQLKFCRFVQTSSPMVHRGVINIELYFLYNT